MNQSEKQKLAEELFTKVMDCIGGYEWDSDDAAIKKAILEALNKFQREIRYEERALAPIIDAVRDQTIDECIKTVRKQPHGWSITQKKHVLYVEDLLKDLESLKSAERRADRESLPETAFKNETSSVDTPRNDIIQKTKDEVMEVYNAIQDFKKSPQTSSPNSIKNCGPAQDDSSNAVMAAEKTEFWKCWKANHRRKDLIAGDISGFTQFFYEQGEQSGLKRALKILEETSNMTYFANDPDADLEIGWRRACEYLTDKIKAEIEKARK